MLGRRGYSEKQGLATCALRTLPRMRLRPRSGRPAMLVPALQAHRCQLRQQALVELRW